MRVLRGARCGSSARRDLRGGHRAAGVPTSILCRFHHSEGEGLVDIFTRNARSPGLLAFQLSMRGRVLGVLQSQADGTERLVYDRGQGFGDDSWADEQALALFLKLSETIP